MAPTKVMSRLLVQESNSDYFLRTFMHENGHRHEDEKKEQESRIWGSRNVTFPKKGEDIRECPHNSLNPSTSVNRWDRIENNNKVAIALNVPLGKLCVLAWIGGMSDHFLMFQYLILTGVDAFLETLARFFNCSVYRQLRILAFSRKTWTGEWLIFDDPKFIAVIEREFFVDIDIASSKKSDAWKF